MPTGGGEPGDDGGPPNPDIRVSWEAASRPQRGPRNGTALFLPYDQGLEHGPRDFFANPAASDPKYIIELALEGGFNGIAMQIGLAEKFYWDYAGEVPLVLKLNGKTDIASAIDPLSPVNATVEDAVRLGADAAVTHPNSGSARLSPQVRYTSLKRMDFRMARRRRSLFVLPVIVFACRSEERR